MCACCFKWSRPYLTLVFAMGSEYVPCTRHVFDNLTFLSPHRLVTTHILLLMRRQGFGKELPPACFLVGRHLMPQAAEKLVSPASEDSHPPKATTRRRVMHKQCLELELFGDTAKTRLQVRRTLRTTSLWITYAPPIELNSSSLAELNRCPVSHMGSIRSHTVQFSTLATAVELCGGEGKVLEDARTRVEGMAGMSSCGICTGNKDYTSQMIVRISSTCGIPFLDIIATPSPRRVRSKVYHFDVLTQTPCGVPKTSANCVHVKANPPNSHTCKAQPFIIQLTSYSTPDRSKLQGTLNSANWRHIFRSQFDLTTFPHLRRHCFSWILFSQLQKWWLVGVCGGFWGGDEVLPHFEADAKFE